MSIGISGAGILTTMTTILQNNQSQLTTLSEELSTGNKSQSLSGYGEQGRQLLDLNTSIAAANAYVSSSATVSTFLNGYDTTLTELVNDATQLSQGLSSLTDATSGSAAASFSSLVSGLQTDVGTTLNTQVGNRYLFSGTRYETPPVQTLSLLPALTTPAAFTAVASPALPSYDTEAGSGPNAAAWATPKVTIEAGETISYGINSNNPAIQQLVFALQNAAAATNTSDPNRSQYLSLAQNAAQQALQGLQGLQASNGANLSQVTSVQSAQKTSVTTLTDLLQGIQGADPTQVSAQISALQTQMQASYKVTGSLLNLSLLNYLGTTTS